MLSKILRFTVLGGVFLLPFIPLLVTESMFFPFISGKNFTFRIIVEIILAAWLGLMLVDHEYRPKRSWIFIAMAVFTIIVALADLFGVNPVRSFWSNFERMEGLVTILHLAAYLFVAGSVLKGETMWNRFWNVSILGSVITCIYAFAQLGGSLAIHQGDVRVDATLGNATYLAVYLLFNIFATLWLLYRHRANRVWTIAYLVVLAMEVIILYYTGTRGTLLGLVGGLGLAALITLVGGRAHPRARRLAGIVVLVLVLGSGGFFLARNTSVVEESPTLSRFANISLKDTTTQSRLILWGGIVLPAFKERPLLGWGQDNFIVVFGKYYDPRMHAQEPWFDRAHNVFFDWLVAAGILGFLAYLFLFGAGLGLLWRGRWPFLEKALLTGLFAAYFFHNIFVFDNIASYLFFVIVLAWIHSGYISSREDGKEKIKETYTVSTAGVRAGAASILVVGIIASVWWNGVYIARSQTLIEAIVEDQMRNNPAQGLAKYEDVLTRDQGLGIDETREQLVQSAVRAYARAPEDPTTVRLILRAKEELLESVEHDPLNTRPLFFVGYLLSRTGAGDEAITYFEKALAINPDRQNFLYEIGNIYMRRSDFTDAIEPFAQAYAAEETNDRAFTFYAATLMHAGKFAEGEALLMDRFGTTTIDNELLFQAYDRVGRNDKIAAILELRLREMAPEDNPSTRVSLALVYLALQRPEDAIREIERAAALSPAFAEQGTQMIEAIRAGKKIKVK
ncbi:MAG: O-antigen ligase family protein [Patescibacteria group bacterium]